MGLFDIFKKKRSKDSPTQEITPLDLKQLSDPIQRFTIHSDVKNLLWIGNGPMKNFFPDKDNKETYKKGIFTISISTDRNDEPSLIYIDQEIQEPRVIDEVSAPPYFPSYTVLNPQQKYIYWDFLSNPYQKSINPGYVFLFYYGLERHLFMNDFENATKAIIKLREVHLNKSFQTYSGNAIVLSCLLHKRADIMQVFLYSLDNDYKRNFSDSLYLFGLHSFNQPLTALDIMRLSKIFGFTNTNYIKGYPEIFEYTLKEKIMIEYSTNCILIEEIVPNISNLPTKPINIFANMSLSKESINVPDLTASKELKQILIKLLTDSHESVKQQLAEMRKNKVIPQKKETSKGKKTIAFDFNQEKILIDELKRQYKNPVAKHFAYNHLQGFYYSYRELDPKFLEECIKYCYADLELLQELNEAFINQEIQRIQQLSRVYSNDEINCEIKRIKERKFNGTIPAFTRLAIIYEKKKEYDYALKVSQDALEYYTKQNMDTSEFEKRISRLNKKKKE